MKLVNSILITSVVLLGSNMALANTAPVANDKTGAATSSNVQNEKANQQDGEIIAFIIALNEHEMKAANEALSKNVTPAEVEFAKQMNTDHGKSLSETKSLSESLHIPANQTSAVKEFIKKGDADLKSLSALTGHAFEEGYANAMVKGHEAALAMMNKFLKEVKNPTLKEHIVKTKATIETHLEHAKKMKESLKKA